MLGVTVLGTGSPTVRGVDRAGPAALVTHQRRPDSPTRHYLVDAGRWVVLRLEQLRIPWPHLDAVLFTHHHMDHNVGWPDVLMSGWSGGRSTRWRVFGPPFTASFCSSMEDAFSYDRDRRPGRLGAEAGALHDVVELDKGGVVFHEDGLRVTAAVVPHGSCVPSFAYRFDSEDRSVVISGDCSPSDSLIGLAADADVLVHEVWHRESFRAMLVRLGAPEERQEQGLAMMSGLHTDAAQLAEVARSAGVRKLMLTHYIPDSFDAAALATMIAATYDGELVLSDDLTRG